MEKKIESLESLYEVELVACVQRILETLARTCPYTRGYVEKRYDATYMVFIYIAKTGGELAREKIDAEASKCPPAISIDKNATSSEFPFYLVKRLISLLIIMENHKNISL